MHVDPTPEQIRRAFSNPSLVFLAPELKPFSDTLIEGLAARDAAVAASDCASCQAGIKMKFDSWILTQWRPRFLELLATDTATRSVFINIVETSAPCLD